MTVINHMVDQLLMQDYDPVGYRQISRRDYEQWARGFVFEGLRDQRYGQSFCNHFNVTDNILYYSSTVDQADRYIQKYYVK